MYHLENLDRKEIVSVLRGKRTTFLLCSLDVFEILGFCFRMNEVNDIAHIMDSLDSFNL